MALSPRPLVGYYPAWSSSWSSLRTRKPPLGNQDWTGITHLICSCAEIKQNALMLYDRAPSRQTSLAALKEQYPHIQILLSLAGEARGFSAAAATAANRQEFVMNAIRFLRRRPFFTGLDLVWKFPVLGDGKEPGLWQDKFNFTQLVQALRHALGTEEERRGQPYLLTLALGPQPMHVTHIEPYELSKQADFISIMAYDFGCGTEAVYPHAPLYEDPAAPFTLCGSPAEQNVAAAILRYLRAGIPAGKLYLGLSFCGRLYTGCRILHRDAYPFCFSTPAMTRRISYRSIVGTYLPHPDTRHYFQPRSLVPYLCHTSNHQFITYEDPTSLRYKVAWAQRLGLGGLTMGELTAEDEPFPLRKAVRTAWQGGATLCG